MDIEILKLVLFGCTPAFIVGLFLTISEVINNKQIKKQSVFIENAKTELKKAGFIFNHSYRLVHKTNEKIAYIRLFDIKYDKYKKDVMVRCYMVTNKGEIGEWYDVFTILLDIKDRWDIIDCGEWNPN